MSIYVTRPFLPPKEEFLKKVSDIFDRGILTNQGPNVQEFEQTMRKFLGIEHFHYVTNGTIALQLALHALGITEGEVITTPFSYVATISSVLWERCVPVFVDIEPNNFTIDVTKIEAIAQKHGLRVIYDAAHTFAARYKGKALCSYGDISTLSFHATKLFHTIEGGACIVNDVEVDKKLDLIKRFGHVGDNHYILGINAKQDEFNAAMGNVMMGYLDVILNERRRLSELYDSLLEGKLRRPAKQKGLEYNYAYYPVMFESEKELHAAFERLHGINVFPRRYFYPSLNTLPYLKQDTSCPISEDISSRIACLPLFVGLNDVMVRKICEML